MRQTIPRGSPVSSSARQLRFARSTLVLALTMACAARLLVAQPPGPASQVSREPIPGTLVTFEMVRVPGGTIIMSDGPVVVNGFHIGRTEVTWDMYDVFALGLDRQQERGAADATARPSEPYGAPDHGWGHSGYPAISITRAGAEAFCRWLSAVTGDVYRLPTEVEWLHASRLAIADLGGGWQDRLAWHQGNSSGRTHRVASKAADALGLFDLFGNAGEWVTTSDGSLAVRGGSFRDSAENVGPDARAVQDPSWNERDPQLPKSRWWLSDAPFVGFRILREPRDGGTRGSHNGAMEQRGTDMRRIPVDSITRRTFIQTTAAAAAAMAFPSGVHAAGSDVIRVGLVGCGGRGTGAARDCLRGSEGVELVALGDLMPDRLAQCRGELAKAAAASADFAAKYKVAEERCFTGFDAYRKVLASDIHLVILATPPGFRPLHLAAAVDVGKHIFAEKPVAVDSAGVRSVLATYETARQKGLGIGAGTQRRHKADYVATVRRIHDGAIGDIMSAQVFWNQGGLWSREPQPEWSAAEWQIRNWLYFTWLSGDHIVEQHVHNIDVANWVLDAHPLKAIGVGGRQARTESHFGHVYDHFAVDFEYPSGARVVSMCRQITGTRGRIGEHFIGTSGRSDASGSITGARAWKFESLEKPVSEFVQEHTDLVASIRAGRPYNELKQIAESTMSAILGREAAYTGQELTWDEVMQADQDLTPPQVEFGPLEVPPVAMPGRTKVARKWNE